MGVQFSFPDNLPISMECRDLISRIFVANPLQRIAIPDIRRHPWFLRNLPAELAVGLAVGLVSGALQWQPGRGLGAKDVKELLHRRSAPFPMQPPIAPICCMFDFRRGGTLA